MTKERIAALRQMDDLTAIEVECLDEIERLQAKVTNLEPVSSPRLVAQHQVYGQSWRKANPNHCPVKLRTGDGVSVGACWHYLRDGRCPDHGQIYQP